jgi:hypothetical protein
MKKTTTTLFRLASVAAVLAASAWLVSCSGDDGAVGPAGKDGTNGTNGTNGENGVGFDDAIAKGNIVLILDGKRPDGVAFKDTLDFRFAPTSPRYSSVEVYSFINGEGETAQEYNGYYANIKRFQSWDGSGDGYYDENGEAGTVRSEVRSETDPAGNPSRQYFWLGTNAATVEFPAEKKYFELYIDSYFDNYINEAGEWEVWGGYGIADSTITTFTKTIAADHKLTYNITYTVPADYNSTGYDLKVTAVANVNLFEQIESNGGSRSSQTKNNSTGRTAAAPSEKVTKAVMKSLN